MERRLQFADLQANTMVAAERLGRVQAEDRVKTAEENLAIAEAAVRDMQVHLQSLRSSSAGPLSPPPATPHLIARRYLSSIVSYTEYIAFIHHLRALRPLREKSKEMFPPPPITALLGQAFLARTVVEDNDTTLRLDIASDLNYFSRSSVKSAAISGDLIIEPVTAVSLMSATSVPHDLTCALCGPIRVSLDCPWSRLVAGDSIRPSPHAPYQIRVIPLLPQTLLLALRRGFAHAIFPIRVTASILCFLSFGIHLPSIPSSTDNYRDSRGEGESLLPTLPLWQLPRTPASNVRPVAFHPNLHHPSRMARRRRVCPCFRIRRRVLDDRCFPIRVDAEFRTLPPSQ